MQKLINSWKEEDLKNPHKLIYNFWLDGEKNSQSRRVYSKIFELDENKQYGFAMA